MNEMFNNSKFEEIVRIQGSKKKAVKAVFSLLYFKKKKKKQKILKLY